MESCCDIIDQLPSEAYNYLFGDKVKDFVQLRSLRSKVKAKIVKFDKLLQNETSVSVPKPRSTPAIPDAPTRVATVESGCDWGDDEELCPDLINFLQLNEDERDSWGLSNDSAVNNFTSKFSIIESKKFRCLKTFTKIKISLSFQLASSIASTSGNTSNYNRTSTNQDRNISIVDLDSPSVSRMNTTSSNVTLMGKFQSHIQNDGITGNKTSLDYCE